MASSARAPSPGRSAPECGQASFDYLGVVAVALAVLVMGTAAAGAGNVAGAVTGQMARALCVAGAGDCDRDRAPCVVSARRTGREGHVNALVVRIGGSAYALLEQRSDGTYLVTRFREAHGGLDVGVGVDAGLKLGGTALLVGGEARAAVLAHRGTGSTWVVRTRKAADALLDRLGDGPLKTTRRGSRGPVLLAGRPLPPPTETFGDRGWSVTLGAKGGIGVGEGALTLTAKDVDGSRLDRRTGRRTVYLRRTNGLQASVDLGKRVAGAGGTAQLDGEYTYSVEFDRDGRPLDLAIVESGAFEGSADLPTRVQPVAGLLGVPTRGARLQQTETHLDLTDGANLAAARAFVAQVTAPRVRLGALARVSAALEDRLEAAGTVQAGTYDLTAKAYGGSGHLAGGLKVGGAYEQEERTIRLVAAVSRGRDGQWTDRTDCVKPA